MSLRFFLCRYYISSVFLWDGNDGGDGNFLRGRGALPVSCVHAFFPSFNIEKSCADGVTAQEKWRGGVCLYSTGGFEQFDAFSRFSLHEFFELCPFVRIFTLHGFVERCLRVVIHLVDVNTGNSEQ